MALHLEICANSLRSAVAAERGGAHRIELCQSLELGGLTPSLGLIRRVLAAVRIPVFVLLRPRAGDFVYDDDELDVMDSDLQACRDLGCAGVVLGVLDRQGRVNIKQCERLVRSAHPMAVTFHRAFDDCADPDQALEDIIAAGFSRILTSAGQESVEFGCDRIAAWIRQASGRIVVMPGAGITPANILKIAKASGAMEFHASAKKKVEDIQSSSRFTTSRFETDTAIVLSLAAALNSDL